MERGTHHTLMEARGKYYDLYMSQFRREEQDEQSPVATGVDIRDDGRRPAS